MHFDRGGRGGRVIDADVVGAGHHVPQVNDPLPRREAPAFRREDIRQHTGLRRQLERQRAVRAGLIREGADRERLGRRGLDAQRHAGPAVAQEMPHRVGEVHLGYDPLGGVSEERAARRVGEGHHAVALEVEHLHREGREHPAAEVGQPFGAPDHGGAERITAIQLPGPAGQEEELVTDGAELRRVADRRRRVIHLERVHRRRVRDVQDAGAVTHARRVEQAILDGRQVVQRLGVLRAFHERRAGRVEELERRRPTRRHVRHEEERPTHIHRLHYRRARAGQREIRVRRAERAGRSATAPLPQIHTGCGARREEDIRTGGGEVRKAGRAPHRCAEHGLAATAGHLEEIDAQIEDQVIAKQHEVIRPGDHLEAGYRCRRRTRRGDDLQPARGLNSGAGRREIHVRADQRDLGRIAVPVHGGVCLDDGEGDSVRAAIQLHAARATAFQGRQVKGGAEHPEALNLRGCIAIERHLHGDLIGAHAVELHGARRIARQQVEETATRAGGEGPEDLDVVGDHRGDLEAIVGAALSGAIRGPQFVPGAHMLRDEVELAVERGPGHIRRRVQAAQEAGRQALRRIDRARGVIRGGFRVGPLLGRELPIRVDRLNEVLRQSHSGHELDGVNVRCQREDQRAGAAAGAVITNRHRGGPQIGEPDRVVHAHRINRHRRAARRATRVARGDVGSVDDAGAVVTAGPRGGELGVDAAGIVDRIAHGVPGGHAMLDLDRERFGGGVVEHRGRVGADRAIVQEPHLDGIIDGQRGRVRCHDDVPHSDHHIVVCAARLQRPGGGRAGDVRGARDGRDPLQRTGGEVITVELGDRQ